MRATRPARARTTRFGRPHSSNASFYLYVVVVLPFSLRSEEHTSELQSRFDLVCRLLLEKKNEFSWGPIPKTTMRTFLVVLLAKRSQYDARLRYRGNGVHVQAFVTHRSVDAHAQPFLPGQ